MTVNITSPLYSLKDSAVNVILRCLPKNSDLFNEAVYEAVNKKERTTLFHAGSDVMIDNMQGVATIITNKEC